MPTKYVAEFRGVQTSDEKATPKKTTDEIVNKKSRIDTKKIGKYATAAIAGTATASNLYARMRATSNSITGDSVSQRKLNNTMAYLNEGLGFAAGVGIGLITEGLSGGFGGFLAMTFRLGMGAFNTAQENRVKQAQWRIESIVNKEKQGRLVQNILGGRL